MSNALALGAVTAVLKNLLDNAVVNEKLVAAVGPVKVSTVAPDRLKTNDQNFVGLNLFLYHLAPNPGWSNTSLPSRDSNGSRIANPPLALDLFYLLSAYGKEDFEAEILLGYGMQLFHEMPVLSREVIRKTFGTTGPIIVTGSSLPSKFQNLAAADLAGQVEQVKITPHALSNEEMSKLWSALLVGYRPSVAYQVSVVLIESRAATHDALPVLRRDLIAQSDLVPPFPTLFRITPPRDQPAVRLGETFTVAGAHLAGLTTRAALRHPIAGVQSIPLAGVTDNTAPVTIPNVAADWPAGVYAVSLVVAGAASTRTTNELPLAVAPVIDAAASTASRDGAGNLTVRIRCSPEVRPEQTATLILGQTSAVSEPHTAATATVEFRFPAAIAPPPGEYFVRLRVDGVESLLVDRSKKPPEFLPGQRLVV